AACSAAAPGSVRGAMPGGTSGIGAPWVAASGMVEPDIGYCCAAAGWAKNKGAAKRPAAIACEVRNAGIGMTVHLIRCFILGSEHPAAPDIANPRHPPHDPPPLAALCRAAVAARWPARGKPANLAAP